ncbi:MAG: serine protease, partial [Candidatus Wildermuthbacteria bacterium]|nr:serine protease [Candidatus Wildermuthbacteria bacterium]
MKKILFLFSVLAIFAVGAFGGLFAQARLLPYMAGHNPYQNWGFVKDWNNRTVIVRQVEQVTIGQRESLARTVENAEKVVVGIQSKKGTAEVAGSGLIYTSEGQIVTLASVVPQGYTPLVYAGNSPEPMENVQVLKRDNQRNLVLLKVERSGLSTASFVPQEDMRL